MTSNSGEHAKLLAKKLQESKDLFYTKLAQISTSPNDVMDSPVIPGSGAADMPLPSDSSSSGETSKISIDPMNDQESPADSQQGIDEEIEISNAIVKKIKKELDKSVELYQKCLESRNSLGYDDIQKSLKAIASLIEALSSAYESVCSNLDEGV